MGRLFDAVASIAGIRHRIAYEAQAACELEAVASESEDAYRFDLEGENIDPSPLIAALVDDVRDRVPSSEISARFHNGVAEMVGRVCNGIRDEYGLERVALSGGVWQNLLLLNKVVSILENDRFTVYVHRRVPANDGGLALGQAAVAASRSRQREGNGAA
jgi:hydrogenase maturation protein HypF